MPTYIIVTIYCNLENSHLYLGEKIHYKIAYILTIFSSLITFLSSNIVK